MARRISSYEHVYRGYEDISHMLPTNAYYKGWRLIWMAPGKADPVYLRGFQGRVIHRWDYIPSLTEVSEKYKELEANHGS